MIEQGYIIEHPTRGVLVDVEHDGEAWKARWSPTKLRSEGRRFGSRADAVKALSRIPARQRQGAAVRAWGSWEVVLGMIRPTLR